MNAGEVLADGWDPAPIEKDTEIIPPEDSSDGMTPIECVSPLFVEVDGKNDEQISEEEDNSNFPITGTDAAIGETEQEVDNKNINHSEEEEKAHFETPKHKKHKKAHKNKKGKDKKPIPLHNYTSPPPSILPPLMSNPQSTGSTGRALAGSMNPRAQSEIARYTRLRQVEESRRQRALETERALEERQRATEERVAQMAAARRQRRLEGIALAEQRAAAAQSLRAQREGEFRLGAYQRLLRGEECEERSAEARAAQAAALQERAADRWLRQHIAAQLAAQAERRREAAARQREAEALARFEARRAERLEREAAERRAVRQAIEQLK